MLELLDPLQHGPVIRDLLQTEGLAAKPHIAPACHLADDHAHFVSDQSRVHVLVAPLSTGKSMVVCQLAIRWARQGHRVLVIPGEMTPLQMTARMDGILGKFNPRILRDRTRIEEFPALRARAQAAFKDLLGEVLFPEKRLVTVKDLWSEARRAGATAIAVDGLYLLPNDSAHAKWEKVTNNSNAIKDGTMESAIDQQPYLQGYLSVAFLVKYVRLGVIPANNVNTGPGFVTKANIGLVEKYAGEYR